MVKRGGEPITVNSAIAAGLLGAVEELYRKQNKKNGGKTNKSKKNGGNLEDMYDTKQDGGMLGSPIEASHLLLDRTNEIVGGDKKDKKDKKNKKGGGHNVGELHPAEVSDKLTIIMNPDGSMPQVGGKKDKKEKKGGSEPASTSAPFTILMPEKQVGGKRNKKDKKQVGGLDELSALLGKLANMAN